MKKSLSITIILLFTFNCSLMAQVNTLEGNEDLSKRAQSFYGELGGNGITISANYDFRFAKKENGFGMRIGLGFFGGSGGGLVTVPAGINYLEGKAPNYLEAGMGYTYGTFTGNDDFLSGDGGLIVPSIGYRYQPAKKGLVARIFISPLVSAVGGGWVFFGGISLGAKL